MKKKKVLPMSLVTLLCVGTFETMKTHAADVTNFNIQADSSWGQEYDQETEGLTGYVNWTSSSHKEWLRLVNSNGYFMALEKLFSYTTNGDLTEFETQVGHYNYLQAKREHIFYPTTIEGSFYS